MRLGGGRLRSGLRAGGERGAGGEEAAGAGAQAREAERAAAEPGGQRGRRTAPAAAAAAAPRRAAPRWGLQPVGSAEPPGRRCRRLGGTGAGAGVGRWGRRRGRQRWLWPRVPGDLLPARPGAFPALQPGAAPRGALRLLQAGGGLLRRGRLRPGAGGRGDTSWGRRRAALAAPHAAGRGGAAGPGERGRLAGRGRLHLVLPSSAPSLGALACDARGGRGLEGRGGPQPLPPDGVTWQVPSRAMSGGCSPGWKPILLQLRPTHLGMNWSFSSPVLSSLLMIGCHAPR